MSVSTISCPHPTSGPVAATRAEWTVAAASDLQRAVTEIARQFEQQETCRVVLTFGSTGQLTEQIEHGLPVDVFAAANIAYLDVLRAKSRLVSDSQRVYARGRIA